MYFNTTATGSQKSSIPADSKYVRRSSLQNNSKKYGKAKDIKARPKPLQLENQKYYEQVFPVRYQKNQKQGYQPDSLNHAEL